MPIYEYRCSACGEKFEKFVRTTSGPVEVRCPNCNTDRVNRQMSVFGITAGASGDSHSSAAGCNTSFGG